MGIAYIFNKGSEGGLLQSGLFVSPALEDVVEYKVGATIGASVRGRP